jgi:hypothetical protein
VKLNFISFKIDFTMKQRLSYVIRLCLIIAISACKPETGDVGPQGPQGDAGAKGDKGPLGDKGAYSAYVSPWVEVKPSDWLKAGSLQPNTFLFTKEEPRLTAGIINKGLIVGYYKYYPEPELDFVYPLPEIMHNYALRLSSYLSTTNNKGYMELSLQFPKFLISTEPVTAKDFHVKVRWLLIPPSSMSRMGYVDWKDYKSVKKAFNLAD